MQIATRLSSRIRTRRWHKSNVVLFLLLIIVGALALALAAPATAVEPASRPNIILIMPDDMGWGDIGAHGHPVVQTPNLDRLFAESTRFTDFHVSPTCAPTRSSLLSGRHEFKNGVTHTIFERERMSLKTITLAEVLRGAGYTTGIFGKWHLGDEEPYQPPQRGFDETFIHGAGGIGQTYPGSCGDAPNNKYHDPYVRHNGTFVRTIGYCTDVFFQAATRWIDGRRQEQQKPFFAMITPNAPHGPLVSPGPRYDALYTGKAIRGKPLAPSDVAYFAMISNIDENIGKLLDQLNRWGIERQTLVIFLSDNGGTHTALYNGGYRAGKASMYSGGTHAPSFWRWPGQIKAGVDVAALTAHIDIFPTLAELAGAPLNGQVQQQVEGRSLRPLLNDPGAAWPDRFLVTHVGRWEKGQAAQSKFKHNSIRNSQYRLVENRELFDLKADRGETKNVIDEHPEVVARLRAVYDQWWNDVQPLLVNENLDGPPENPYHVLFRKQFPLDAKAPPDAQGKKKE